jgi:hypothetical protein
MYIVVRYYKPERNGPGHLKNKVLRHSEKEVLKKPELNSNSITKTPTVSNEHFHRGCLDGLTSHLYELAILLLLL